MGNKDSGVPVRGSPRPARRGDRSGGAADSPPVACADARARMKANLGEVGNKLVAKQMCVAGGSYTCCEAAWLSRSCAAAAKCQRGEATRRRVRPVALASLQRPSANLYLTTIRLVAQPWIAMQRRELVAEGKLKLLGNK